MFRLGWLNGLCNEQSYRKDFEKDIQMMALISGERFTVNVVKVVNEQGFICFIRCRARYIIVNTCVVIVWCESTRIAGRNCCVWDLYEQAYRKDFEKDIQMMALISGERFTVNLPVVYRCLPAY